MVPEKYRLPAIGRFLIDAFERRRPAILKWDEATEAQLRAEADLELVSMKKQLVEIGIDDPGYWAKVSDSVDKVVIPRYLALARAENERAAREYGMWRGGDLIARGTFALVGLLLGALLLRVPGLPIFKLLPWVLFVAGPFLPDAYFWWYHRRYGKQLEGLLGELERAAQDLQTYRPLSEVQRSLGGGEPASSEAEPAPMTRTRSG